MDPCRPFVLWSKEPGSRPVLTPASRQVGIAKRFLGQEPRASVLLFLRFGIVGLLNTAFGYVVFAGLCLTGLRPLVALIGSTLAGVAFNFQTSSRLVFRTRGRVLRSCLVYLAILALNWVLLRMMNGAGFSPIEAQAVLALPLSIGSFVGQKVLVFGIAG